MSATITKECGYCGKLFTPKTKRSLVCSIACGQRRYRLVNSEKIRARRKRPTIQKSCRCCGLGFLTVMSRRLYCSTRCRAKFHYPVSYLRRKEAYNYLSKRRNYYRKNREEIKAKCRQWAVQNHGKRRAIEDRSTAKKHGKRSAAKILSMLAGASAISQINP